MTIINSQCFKPKRQISRVISYFITFKYNLFEEAIFEIFEDEINACQAANIMPLNKIGVYFLVANRRMLAVPVNVAKFYIIADYSNIYEITNLSAKS